MAINNIHLKNEYHSLDDDIAKEFYIPLLSNAKIYQRAVGFFSSSILLKISVGIAALAKKGGSIQIIASPYLSNEDIDAINSGYKDREQIIKNAIEKELKDTRTYDETNRLNLLANLIANGVLDFKIAYTDNCGKFGMFHDKFGIITDENENKVAFSGSMNESLNGIMYNSESFDVYCSWKEADEKERIREKEERFNKIWNREDSKVTIIDFVDLNKEIVNKYKKFDPDLEIDATSVYPLEIGIDPDISSKSTIPINIPIKPKSLDLFDYQKDAILAWEKNNFIGIYDMATGTGKTLTALGSVVHLFNKCKRLAVVICCPFQHLVDQWVEDIEKFNIIPIVAYSGHDYKRKLSDAVFDYNLGITDFFCLVCTNGTYVTNRVQTQIEKIKGNALIVVDEAHNFGASSLSQKMTPIFNYRLALSATLDRHDDIEGTKKLYDYFGQKCITYDLGRAIREKKLTPYIYKPILVSLTDTELEDYEKLSTIIGKHIIEKNGKKELDDLGKIKAQERSRLVAGAFNKTVILKSLMEENKEEHNMLVYCGATKISKEYTDDDDIRQIDYISRMLGNELSMDVAQFTSNEDAEERQRRIKAFTEGDIQALIAIKCLDEGVNIPKIKTAFILASTTNPKEYIQRRGRVLRKAKGKEFAIIYDFVTIPRPIDVVPNLTEYELSKDRSLVIKEITRIKEFKTEAMNPIDSDNLIDELMDVYSLYDYKPEDEFNVEVIEDE